MAPKDEQLSKAIRTWNGGEQQVAVDLIRPLADTGDPSALLLICWWLQQVGSQPEALEYAKKAAPLGNQWILANFFGPLVDQPDGRPAAIEMVRANPTSGFVSNDPLGRALEIFGQGEEQRGLEMLRAAAGWEGWPPDAEGVRKRLTELEGALSSVDAQRDVALEGIEVAKREVEAAREGFKTRESTLTQLLDNLTNASSQSHFDEQATKYEEESRRLWLLGVLVLAAAAVAAFLPVVLSYFGDSHKLTGQSNVTAHLGATLALAAVAGVLLARARSRDRDRQRNRDLSVALGTMFAYSEQIANEEEKERFKHDMGRLVLETFLRQKPPTEDGSRNVLSDIVDPGGSSKPPQEVG
ncbi:MAG TPA: hypothetical protein VF125_00515 [Solirubrobacterales bacterium]